MNCPYCKKEAEWVENKEIYGKNYGKSVMVYLCQPCNAYVGCHNNTRKPLGIMANADTRKWRQKAHAVFDPLWQKIFKRNSTKRLNREAMYNRISNAFGCRVHIAESDIDRCKKIIEWCNQIKGIGEY